MDWFDRVTGGRWNDLRGENRMATGYNNRRTMRPSLPKDDEVVVVVDGNGKMLAVHNSELE